MKYRVNGIIGISAYTIVEAKSPDDAIEIASLRDNMGLPYMSNAYPDDEFWVVDELDGTPRNFTVDEP